MTLFTALWCTGHISAALFLWELRYPGQPIPMPKCGISARKDGP